MAEVYGTAYIETANDKLKALVDDLITDTTGDSPKISYAYQRHNVAYLRLNAVTIDLDGIDVASSGAPPPLVKYMMRFTVRVHVAYANQAINGQTVAKLVNSVINKLNDNLNLGDGYRIWQIDSLANRQEFDESASRGGEIAVTIWHVESHTQE